MAVDPEIGFTADVIRDPSRFVGRTELIRDCISAINASAGLISVFGKRGVGKSSLLRQIQQMALGDYTLAKRAGLGHLVPKRPRSYLNEADVERQLTLESYGYRFLRLNRFNLGADPVTTLSERLELLAASAVRSDPTGSVKAISEQAIALAEKSAKACERCGGIKPLALFFDKALGGGKGGTGRICASCKQSERTAVSHSPRRRRRRWR